MKSIFSGFYTPSEEEFNKLWDECTFVFDTNTLLNLYRYDKKTRDLLFKVMELIKSRMWLPHQIALEYHKHMLNEIYDQEDAYRNITDKVKNAVTSLENELNNLRHSNIDVKKIKKYLENVREDIGKELEMQKKSHPDLSRIKDNITDLFDEKIGHEYSQERLNEIYRDGSSRYENKIPPGYKDIKGKENKKTVNNGLIYQDMYGDLIYWLQILDKAKEESTKSIILVTDDNKEDWVLTLNGKKKGPQPELINEFKRETGGKLFYLYNTEQFLKFAKKYLKVPDASLDNAEIDKAIQNVKTTKELLNVIHKEDQIENQSVNAMKHYITTNFKMKKRPSLNKSYQYGYTAILKLLDPDFIDYDKIVSYFARDFYFITNSEIEVVNISVTSETVQVEFIAPGLLNEEIVSEINTINILSGHRAKLYEVIKISGLLQDM
ncbi:PIN-like domain-containing protein [Paenibacillus macerans]|uniref:PIN-like domain-containing protein n=1 Tax=Paenibacillus macerans TaxID=44252 RepID=UPI003D31A968